MNERPVYKKSMARSSMRFIIPLLYILSPLVPISLYLEGAWYSIASPWTIAIVLGISSYIWYCNLYVIIVRPRRLEHLFGLTALYRFHGMMAMSATVLAFAHGIMRVSSGDQFVILSGVVALLIYIFVIIVTLLFMVRKKPRSARAGSKVGKFLEKKFGIRYHHAKIVHNFVAFATLIMLFHVLRAYSTQEQVVRSMVMGGWYLLSVGCYAYHKVVKPLRLRRNSYEVCAVEHPARSICTIRMRPGRKKTSYKAGQFAFFSFMNKSPGKELHPFTISSAPAVQGDELSISVKASGDYTQHMSRIHIGTKVAIEGPFGDFTMESLAEEGRTYMVAGGIGITPFLSIIRELSQIDPRRHITLLWSCAQQGDFIYEDEFKDLQRKMPNLKIEFIIASPETLIQQISHFIGGAATSHYLLCGPPPMMQAVSRMLSSFGIRRQQVFSEQFAF